jgi:uncharacterized cupredoxin-like copper-binding protein
MRLMIFAVIAMLGWFASAPVGAEDLTTYRLSIKGHKFDPAELHVVAGKPFFLVVTNQDGAADEFEMGSPPLEKVLQPGASGQMRVRPLSAGRFTFFDDFHPDTPKGAIVAQ